MMREKIIWEFAKSLPSGFWPSCPCYGRGQGNTCVFTSLCLYMQRRLLYFTIGLGCFGHPLSCSCAWWCWTPQLPIHYALKKPGCGKWQAQFVHSAFCEMLQSSGSWHHWLLVQLALEVLKPTHWGRSGICCIGSAGGIERQFRSHLKPWRAVFPAAALVGSATFSQVDLKQK